MEKLFQSFLLVFLHTLPLCWHLRELICNVEFLVWTLLHTSLYHPPHPFTPTLEITSCEKLLNPDWNKVILRIAPTETFLTSIASLILHCNLI
jgi:hypothetical protein